MHWNATELQHVLGGLYLVPFYILTLRKSYFNYERLLIYYKYITLQNTEVGEMHLINNLFYKSEILVSYKLQIQDWMALCTQNRIFQHVPLSMYTTQNSFPP